MCLLCIGLAGEEHWTDAPVLGSGGASAARARRRVLVARVLAAHGLDYGEGPGGTGASVSNRKGDVRLASDLGEVWAHAGALRGTPLDPLDPRFLDRLREERPS